MKWNVEGADAATGKEHVYRVEADTAAEAEKVIRRKGILVSAVHASIVKDESPPDGAIDDLEVLAEATPRPRKTAPDIPNYTGLIAGATALLIIAMLMYMAGALIVAGMIWDMVVSATSPANVDIYDVKIALATAASSILSGAMLHTLGAAARALRDIARNSFRK